MQGNFDHYEPHQPGFMAAHVFGCVRFTLDVWERYLGQPIEWHFRDAYDRLEISLLPWWDNAQYGYGFLEVGSQQDESGHLLPFGLDFDIIAHEVGHAVIYSVLGVPGAGQRVPGISRLPGILCRLRVAGRGDALSLGRRHGALPRRAAISTSPTG